ncbi:hypothetical protein PAXINDRAFT_16988 [Paxillus involutus ATCC 200175]|uniref:Unplaced genomic scaffold PAXINscaffold_102, whole genome shotgun sequence n=1 Tax=Paxillus involutus ATCC 200175 TaxID=664439 RepID=A0A0C9T2P5_PAXIN|nr:hypothetical protein PAXINDRAFT_16988 [Paxillus involutus ATCC 200175]
MAEIPALRTDGQNWLTWRANLEEALEELGISAYLSQTTPNPYNEQANTLAKCAIASTIPDSLFLQILRFKSAYECFETLRTLFEKPTTTTAVQYELRSDKYKWEATYGLETVNDHVRTRKRARRQHSHAPGTTTTQVDHHQPRQMLYDQRSNGEGRGEGVGGDDKVEGNDDREMLYGDNKRRRQKEEARDEASRDDEEGLETREVEGMLNEGKERMTVTSVNEDSQLIINDEDNSPSPPLPPNHLPTPEPPQLDTTPSPSPPERRNGNIDTAKSNKTPAQRHADAVHDPGGKTDTPGSVPPSVWLEGERNRATSLNVETDDNEVDEMKPSRNPVGTTDGDACRPSEPTEPPDKKEGERGVDTKSRDKTMVENIESKMSNQDDKPEGRGDKRDKLKEVEVEARSQSEGEGCHRDGRMIRVT